MHACTTLASALMFFSAVAWIHRLPARVCDDASGPAERALACMLLNVAAFDLWLLSSNLTTALRLWAWHAAVAGVVTLASSAPGTAFRPVTTPSRLGSTLAYLLVALLIAGLTTPVVTHAIH